MIHKELLKVSVSIDYSKVNYSKIKALYDVSPYSLKSHYKTLRDFIRETIQYIIETTSFMINRGNYTFTEYITNTLSQIDNIKARYYTDFLLALNQ